MLVGGIANCRAAEVDKLDGWREFKFGMSPSEVENISALPLKCDPLNAMGGGTGNLFITNVSIGDIPFRVALAFKGAQYGYSCEFPKASLNRVTLIGGPISPCPLKTVLQNLENTYGRFETSEDGIYAVHNFKNNTVIQVFSPLRPQNSSDLCAIQIKYMTTLPALPPPPPLPTGRF